MARMTPVGPRPGPGRGPHVMGAAVHELGAVGNEATPNTMHTYSTEQTTAGGTYANTPQNDVMSEVGVAPVMEGLIGEGRNSFRVHTNEQAAPPPAVKTNQVLAAPDFLDDRAVDTSQALIPVDNNNSYGADLNSSQATGHDFLDDVAVETNLSNDDEHALVTVDISEPPAVTRGESTEATPVIAGLGRIERNNAPKQAPQKRERITVPERSVNGGFDFKFDYDPANVNLCDLMTPEEYHDAISALNETMRPSRSNTVDAGLLITGPLIVPLAFWGVRHSKLVKKRKLLLNEAIVHFNDIHPDLYMRYHRTSAASYLTIEKRKEEHIITMTGVEESWMDREPVV